MSQSTPEGVSRRDALKTAGQVAAVSALAGVAIPHVHAQEDNDVRVALIGCGGRGGGAAENALSVPKTIAPTKLVAMVDVFPDRLSNVHQGLARRFEKKVDVPEERRFLGFNGYKNAIDCLRPGDIAILTTPPAFRWVMFQYALQKGVNVFMEKPTTVDGPSTRKMLALAEESEKKGTKVGVGLMCRHCDARRELFKRVKGGQLGDVLLLRAYRQAGPTGSAATKPRDPAVDKSELLFQIKRFHSFLWLSGGGFSDFLIHNIDECCWIKDAWPVKADGTGGRHFRDGCIDQNFDSYSVEFTYADGTKLHLEGRTMPGCKSEFASYLHGSKGSAVISSNGHWPSRARIFKGQVMKTSEVVWDAGRETYNPYQAEWDRLVDAIVKNTPHNEAKRGAEASLVTAMGRMAAHTGRVVTYDEALANEQELAPHVDKLTFDSPAPVLADKDGKYPIPEPGKKGKLEY